MKQMENEFTKYVPKKGIKLDIPRSSGIVITCHKCETVFRAKKGDTCPFCHEPVIIRAKYRREQG